MVRYRDRQTNKIQAKKTLSENLVWKRTIRITETNEKDETSIQTIAEKRETGCWKIIVIKYEEATSKHYVRQMYSKLKQIRLRVCGIAKNAGSLIAADQFKEHF